MAGTKQQVEGIAAFRASTLLATTSDRHKSLNGIDTTTLPDRSTCFVEENDQLYRYFQSSVAAESLPDVVAPLKGPGRWLLEAGGGGGGGSSDCCGDFAYTGTNIIALPGTIVPGVPVLTLNTAAAWVPEPDNGDFSVVSPGVVQYNGASPCRVKVELQYLLTVDQDAFVAIAFGRQVGIAPPDPIRKQSGCFLTADTPCQIETFGLLTLNPGDRVNAYIGQGTVASPGTVDATLLGSSLTLTCCECGGTDGGGVFAARITSDVAQTLVAGAGAATIAFNLTAFDQLGIANTAGNSLDIVDAGKYLIVAEYILETRQPAFFDIVVDGTPTGAATGIANQDNGTISTVIELASGQVVTLTGGIDAGGSNADVVPAALSAVKLNGGVGGGSAALQSSRMRQTVTQTLDGGATTTVDFDVSDFDDLGVVDLAGDRFLITTAGRYLVGYHLPLVGAPTAATTARILLDGTTVVVGDQNDAASGERTNGSEELQLAAGAALTLELVNGGATPADDVATLIEGNGPVMWIVRLS